MDYKVLCLPKEFSVGTNLNKYLDQDGEEDLAKRDGEKRTTALWFGPRLGKRLKTETSQFHMVELKFSSFRNQATADENLPIEILEILEKIQKSPELQNILAEKLQVEGHGPYVIYIPSGKIFSLLKDSSTNNFYQQQNLKILIS